MADERSYRYGAPPKKLNRAPVVGPDVENIRAYGSQRNAQAGQLAANQARQILPTQYTDPFAGQSPWDLAQQLLTAPVGSQQPRPPGGGSRNDGGGAGGGADPAVLQAAYQSMLGQQFDPSPYDPSGMLAAYSDAPINGVYDRMSRDVGAATLQGTDRLNGITGQLNDRAAVARGAVGQSFDQSRAALEQVRQQALASQTQQMGGVNDVLTKFGAGSVAPPGTELDQLLTGLQGVQVNARGAYDQTLADRGEAYAGLGADVQQGMTQQATGLQSQIAGQRAAQLAAQAQQRAKIQADMELARSQAQAAWNQQQQEIRLQAAQLGIDLGPIPPAPGI